MEDSTKRVIVLGSGGFIGKSVMEYLSSEPNFDIVGISSSEVNLIDEKQASLRLPDLLRDSIVIMTSAITRDRDDSINAMIDNIKMAVNIVKVINDNPPSHLIYISSVDVYGRKGLSLPLNESSRLIPSNYYAISKLASEFILNTACNNKKIPFTALRPSFVYGPGDTHNNLIMKIIMSALKKENIKLIGYGTGLRDFLYVNDVDEIIKVVMLRKLTGIYNIVTEKSYPINNIVKIVETLCGYPLKIEYCGENEDMDLIFEKSKFIFEVPEFNFTDIEAGIKQTLNYYAGVKNGFS